MAKGSPEKRIRFRLLRSQVGLIGGSILLVYLLLANILAIFQVYRIDREIVALRQKAAELEVKNQDLQNLIAYLKTDSFKEKEARRKLNYRKEGEKVLVLPNPVALSPETQEGEEATSSEDRVTSLPTYLKWWYYFFEK